MTSKEEMTRRLEVNAATAPGGVYLVYIDLDIITDSELLEWTIAECKRVYGEDIEIITNHGDKAKADGYAAVRASERSSREAGERKDPLGWSWDG